MIDLKKVAVDAYDRKCPDCGMWLDYVFNLEKRKVGYWCRTNSCNFFMEVNMKEEGKDENE